MLTRRITTTALGVAAAGFGYALLERNSYVLRRYEIPVLPAGMRPLRILHLSDLHATARHRSELAFVHELARFEPDLVINTGDNWAADSAFAPLMDSLDPLLDLPGAFVFGSNDYHRPVFKNPARYLLPDNGTRRYGGDLDANMLRRALTNRGWIDLNNRRGAVRLAGRTVSLVGVDDPHVRRDRFPDGHPEPESALIIGVTHSPEPHVLNQMTAAGASLILAGHTHGGQLCLPGYGTIVTNCGIDRARAKGLSRWGDAWLHVSAGLGTSPYAPVRFACRPEASLLTLTPAPRPAPSTPMDTR